MLHITRFTKTLTLKMASSHISVFEKRDNCLKSATKPHERSGTGVELPNCLISGWWWLTNYMDPPRLVTPPHGRVSQATTHSQSVVCIQNRQHDGCSDFLNDAGYVLYQQENVKTDLEQATQWLPLVRCHSPFSSAVQSSTRGNVY